MGNIDFKKSDIIAKQIECLKNEIQNKHLHKKFLTGLDNKKRDDDESSVWLYKGNNTPQSKGIYCYLQDRNVFFKNKGGACRYCKEKKDDLIILRHNVLCSYTKNIKSGMMR
jgi:hypothetical protein